MIQDHSSRHVTRMSSEHTFRYRPISDPPTIRFWAGGHPSPRMDASPPMYIPPKDLLFNEYGVCSYVKSESAVWCAPAEFAGFLNFAAHDFVKDFYEYA